jgi:hypothetical protein
MQQMCPARAGCLQPQSKDLEAFTGLQRPAAQARFLEKLGMKFVRRPDGSVALRQAELDANTMLKPFEAKRPEPQLKSLQISLANVGASSACRLSACQC